MVPISACPNADDTAVTTETVSLTKQQLYTASKNVTILIVNKFCTLEPVLIIFDTV